MGSSDDVHFYGYSAAAQVQGGRSGRRQDLGIHIKVTQDYEPFITPNVE